MKKLKTIIPYLLITVLTFYLLPLIGSDLGVIITLLWIVIPAISLITSFVFGVKNGFFWWYAIIIFAMFIPPIFIFYNSSALPYALAYGVISLFGSFVGSLIYRRKK